jgi:hypothetical protein
MINLGTREAAAVAPSSSSFSASSSSASVSCTHVELLQFVEETQKATRAFAKRQFTWFRGEKPGLYTWISSAGGCQSELDDAVLKIFHRSAEDAWDTVGDTGDTVGDASGDTVGDAAGSVSPDPSTSTTTSGGRISPLIDAERGEVDKETANELKRYRAEQKIVISSVSDNIRRRVDRLAADLAGSIPRGN